MGAGHMKQIDAADNVFLTMTGTELFRNLEEFAQIEVLFHKKTVVEITLD